MHGCVHARCTELVHPLIFKYVVAVLVVSTDLQVQYLSSYPPLIVGVLFHILHYKVPKSFFKYLAPLSTEITFLVIVSRLFLDLDLGDLFIQASSRWLLW